MFFLTPLAPSAFQTISATSQNCIYFLRFCSTVPMCVDLDPDIIVTPLSWTMDIDLSSFDNSFGPNTFKCNIIIVVMLGSLNLLLPRCQKTIHMHYPKKNIILSNAILFWITYMTSYRLV